PVVPGVAAAPLVAGASEHARAGDGDEPARPLPRRVPRRETASEEDGSAGPLPFIPRARTESAPAGSTPPATPGTTPSATTATAPAATPGTPPPAAPGTAPSATVGDASGAGDGGSRPLRRRVRGATLRTAAGGAAAPACEPAPQADADAVRSALEEFEAAVERAHRDTGTHPRPALRDDPGAAPGAAPRTQYRNDLPEGAEQ
ncbi:ATP-binding protein, partial [Streptomyces seoulensis]